jgi:hypothetical protein
METQMQNHCAKQTGSHVEGSTYQVQELVIVKELFRLGLFLADVLQERGHRLSRQREMFQALHHDFELATRPGPAPTKRTSAAA